MLQKNDCISLLVKLEDSGVPKKEIDKYITQVIVNPTVPIEALKFIVANNGIKAVDFYEYLRKKHNKDNSPLYTNIISDNPRDDTITTLACLLTQIVLFSNKLSEDKEVFLHDVRAEEITKVLNTYFSTGAIEDCETLISLIKTDLLVLEYLNGRRELDTDA